MTEAMMLTVAASLVAALFGLLVAVLGWIGNKIYSKLEELNDTLHRVEGDLHEKINSIDQRVIWIEANIEKRRGNGT